MVRFLSEIFWHIFQHTIKILQLAAVNFLLPSLQLLVWHKTVLKQPFDLKNGFELANFTSIGQNRLEFQTQIQKQTVSVVIYRKCNKNMFEMCAEGPTCLTMRIETNNLKRVNCAPEAQKLETQA